MTQQDERILNSLQIVWKRDFIYLPVSDLFFHTLTDCLSPIQKLRGTKKCNRVKDRYGRLAPESRIQQETLDNVLVPNRGSP